MSAAGTATGHREGAGAFDTAEHTGGARAGRGLAGYLRRALGLHGALDGAALARAARAMAPFAQADERRALAREQGCCANNLCTEYVPGQYVRRM